jgi:hypothetical protein
MLYSQDLNHLKLYCVYASALFTGIVIVPDDGWYCKLKHVAKYTCHPPGTWNLEVGGNSCGPLVTIGFAWLTNVASHSNTYFMLYTPHIGLSGNANHNILQ